MKTTKFEQVNSKSTILVDLASLSNLALSFDRLSWADSNAVNFYECALRDNDLWTEQLFEILSNLICFDNFIIDKRALYFFDGATRLLETLHKTGLESYFSAVVFPAEPYDEAQQRLAELVDTLFSNLPEEDRRRFEDKNLTKSLENILGYEETRWVDDETYALMYDGAGRMTLKGADFDTNELPSQLATTGLGVERLFVYLEFGRMLGIPATLARAKYKSAENIGKKLSESIDRMWQATLEKLRNELSTGVDDIQEHVSKAVFDSMSQETLLMPPLPGYILQMAKRKGYGILDAVKAIREDPVAAAFREYVWDARSLWHAIYARDELKARELKQNLHNLGKRLASAQGITDLFRDPVELPINFFGSIAQLPALTDVVPGLTDLAGLLKSVKMKLPFSIPRRLPLYEVFIARWFF